MTELVISKYRGLEIGPAAHVTFAPGTSSIEVTHDFLPFLRIYGEIDSITNITKIHLI